MYTQGTLVRYREGTELAGEVYVVAESQYSPTSWVLLVTDSPAQHWANPKFIESAETVFYTVWVGGAEVNDHLLTIGEADVLADDYRSQGYDDVVIEAIV